MNPTWTVIESRDSFARVEAVDAEGNRYVSVFSGPRAEAFADEYVAWKNGEQEQLMAVLQMRQGLLENTMDAFGGDLQKRVAAAIANSKHGMAFLEAPLTNIGDTPIGVALPDDFEGVPI